jgi:transposase-like protein
VALSESEPHWRQFLRSLLERGMHGVRMVTSDDHSGVRAALAMVVGHSIIAVPTRATARGAAPRSEAPHHRPSA